MTRRRHGLPPQPLAWFRNLMAYLGDRVDDPRGEQGRPADREHPDAVVQEDDVLQVRRVGCGASPSGRHAVPVLARDSGRARRAGFEELDLGRSDLDQPGLIAFKDHLGATRSTLTYYRYPARSADAARQRAGCRASRAARSRYLPDAALDLAGRLIYKHLG